MSGPITTRGELLEVLAEAAELEHGIACSYLYAAFSLKREVTEGGMTWTEQQLVRRWAAQLYFIASQEMLHLALVWNLTTAIGGAPYAGRPNIPQNSRYYPLDVPLAFEPFGYASLRRFIRYEHPDAPRPEVEALLRETGEDGGVPGFGSVGALYGLIRGAFESIDPKHLFVGAPGQQMTPALAHFPNLVAVQDRASAIAAVEEIVHQGEGVRADRPDSHFGAFVAMLRELRDTAASGSGFAPARRAMRNPAASDEPGYGAAATAIADPLARRVAGLFDSAYSLMLRTLAWSFEFDATQNTAQLADFCRLAINLMPLVILPLGEGLTLMPAGGPDPELRAGAGFGLVRPLRLPADARLARLEVAERLTELAHIARGLGAEAIPAPVRAGCAHLNDLAKAF